ncbi:MAG TPA: trehalose-6-phosphate synthase [Acidimicrobiales bacterium]|nr:trehalose-6-phosphate synthase [Acidimicrobiales bacterium]
MGADLVIASNRGPLSFALDDTGRAVPVGSAGGLAGALHPMLEGSGATWVACAMSEADRKATTEGLMTERGLRLVMVQPDADTYRMAYDVVSNATLWFAHHGLFDLPRRPRFDRHFHTAWDAYRRFNALFAEVVADVADPGATVLVQDYHLCLVPGLLARHRPDLRTVHFTHTPFADPAMLRVLPSAPAGELLRGMAGAAACGFHTARWEAAFLACCADAGVPAPRTYVSPLTPAPDHLAERAASPECVAAGERLEELLRGRRMVLRVDRIEPAKNLLRGFWAFDELLRLQPRLRGSVVLLALAYPSRQTLPEYLAYGAEVEQVARYVNETWGTDDWAPIVLDVADDAERSLAALVRYDVLLVNPLRDGLNLVAKEGPLVNTTDGVLALSREAGAFAELHEHALEVNPFDVAGTAEVMARALAMEPRERAGRAAGLRDVVLRRKPGDWLADQLAAAVAG